MKEKIILIGGGGHCKSCVDVIESEGKYQIVGVLDLIENKGQNILGYEVIGSDDDINRFDDEEFLITIGQIKSSQKRKAIFELLLKLNKKLANVISLKARLARTAVIGTGTILMHNSLVNSDSVIGSNCIINTGAIIEHDCRIFDHCHISTNAVINGNCNIGEGCFIGSHSTVIQGVKIASNCVIGAGAVVVRDIVEKGIYAGNPAKRIG